MKKRNLRQRQFQTMNRKVLCGRFAERLNYNFAVGDDANNLLVYNLHNQKPLTVLNSQTSNVSALTSLIFSDNEENVIVGSSRGSINVWDLNTLRISYCLRGHGVEVSSFAIDSNNDNILVSGSYDTSVRVWDTRLKNMLHTIKTHTRKVGSLAISPDSHYLLSGSQDGTVQLFDLKTFRPLYTYSIDSDVNSLAFHKHSMIFACGCGDRMARLFPLNSPSLICSTKPEAMPVVSTCFYGKGFLFTAASESLKLWDVRNGGCFMTDNIENTPKGILDLVVTETQTQVIAYAGGVLSLSTCRLDSMSFKGEYTHVYNPKKQQTPEPQVRRGNSLRKPVIQQLTTNGIKSTIQKRNESIARTVANVQQDASKAINNVMKLQDQLNKNRIDAGELASMMQQHNKFVSIMTSRCRTISQTMSYWSVGNTKSIITLLKTCQPYTAADILTHILKPSKFPISVDFGIVIVEHSKEMLAAKHVTLIKHGLGFLNQILNMFKDDIVRVRMYPQKGVDLAMEERLRKYERLVELLVEVFQHPRMKKLMAKREELSRQAEQLYEGLNQLFKKLFNGQDNF